MPDQATTEPWPQPLPDASVYRRCYRDALGRPMTGQVTITPASRVATDDQVITDAPVVVALAGGVLTATLTAGTYQLSADLTSVDRRRVVETDTAVID